MIVLYFIRIANSWRIDPYDGKQDNVHVQKVLGHYNEPCESFWLKCMEECATTHLVLILI